MTKMTTFAAPSRHIDTAVPDTAGHHEMDSVNGAIHKLDLGRTGFFDLPNEIQDIIFDLLIPQALDSGITWAPNGWVPHEAQASLRKSLYLRTGMVSCLPRHPTMFVSRGFRSVAIRSFWRWRACKLYVGWKFHHTRGSTPPRATLYGPTLAISGHWVSHIRYLSLEALDWTRPTTQLELRTIFQRLHNLKYLHLGLEVLPKWQSQSLFNVLERLPWIRGIANHPTLKYFSVSSKPEWRTWYPLLHYTNDPEEDLGSYIIEHFVRISIKARDLPAGIKRWDNLDTGAEHFYQDLNLISNGASLRTQMDLFATLREMFPNEQFFAGNLMCEDSMLRLYENIEREEAERRELREWQRYDTIVRRQNADALQPPSAMAVDEWHSDLQSESDDTRWSDSML